MYTENIAHGIGIAENNGGSTQMGCQRFLRYSDSEAQVPRTSWRTKTSGGRKGKHKSLTRERTKDVGKKEL